MFKKDKSKVNINQAQVDALKKILNEKEKFYELMQYYFDNGTVREVYSTDYYCLLCFGEIFYMVCPYMVRNDVPIGIFLDIYKLDEIIVKVDFTIGIIQNVLSDMGKYKSMIHLLGSSKENKTYIKNFIKEKKAKGITMVDHDLEKRIR